jgi:hypothetical protein
MIAKGQDERKRARAGPRVISLTAHRRPRSPVFRRQTGISSVRTISFFRDFAGFSVKHSQLWRPA